MNTTKNVKRKKEIKKKRDNCKYPALNPRYNAKTRFEVIEFDYLDKLSESEMEVLNQFMAEYVSGSFKKNKDGSYSDSNYHKTSEERKECYSRNNKRNRCSLTISNATGNTIRSDHIEDLIDHVQNDDSDNTYTNHLIDNYNGDEKELEKELLEQMEKDYNKLKKKNELDSSNYGKRLKLIFENPDLKKES